MIRRASPKYENQIGVTLLELLVAVAVLGILAAIAVPNYGDYINRQRLVGAAEGVYSQLQLARRAAVSNNKSVAFVVENIGSNTWCASFSEDTSLVCDDAFVTSSTSNKSSYVRGEDFSSSVILSSDSGLNYTQFSMPGLTVSGASSYTASISGFAAVEVAVGAGMQLSICSNDLGRYQDCTP